jgi:GT2 family glycosyltransferase
VNSASETPTRQRDPRVLLIVPAYNEARSLPRLIEQIRSLHPSYEVAVINDGSSDDTAQVVGQLPVRLISLPCNLGIGGAIRSSKSIFWSTDCFAQDATLSSARGS